MNKKDQALRHLYRAAHAAKSMLEVWQNDRERDGLPLNNELTCTHSELDWALEEARQALRLDIDVRLGRRGI